MVCDFNAVENIWVFWECLVDNLLALKTWSSKLFSIQSPFNDIRTATVKLVFKRSFDHLLRVTGVLTDDSRSAKRNHARATIRPQHYRIAIHDELRFKQNGRGQNHM